LPGDLQSLARYLDEIEWELFYLPETGSTMSLARELIGKGQKGNLLVITDYQRAGRGRRGRGWFAPPQKNILVSLVTRPTPSAHPTLYTLNAAASGVSSLRMLLEKDSSLSVKSGEVWSKWPNDIYWGERKTGGVLGETARDRDGRLWLIIGVGINLNLQKEELPDELKDRATGFLIETGKEAERAGVLEGFMESFRSGLALLGESPERLIERWEALSRTPGAEVSVRTEREVIVGRATGLDGRGFLRIITPDGSLRVVETGEVYHLRHQSTVD